MSEETEKLLAAESEIARLKSILKEIQELSDRSNDTTEIIHYNWLIDNLPNSQNNKIFWVDKDSLQEILKKV